MNGDLKEKSVVFSDLSQLINNEIWYAVAKILVEHFRKGAVYTFWHLLNVNYQVGERYKESESLMVHGENLASKQHSLKGIIILL